MTIKDEEDKNSINSDVEEVEVKDKDDEDEAETVKNEENDDEEDDEEEDDDEEDDDEEDDDEDEDDDDEDDEDEEYDQNVIQFELFKNFLVDDEGNNIATNLKSIAHELRTLNKIAKLYLKDK